MLNFIIFLLSTFGATMIITNSFLFKGIRKFMCSKNIYLGKLFKCTQCVGFHVALMMQFLILIHERNGLLFNWIDIYFILYGFIGSIFCYIGYLLLKPLIDKYD